MTATQNDGYNIGLDSSILTLNRWNAKITCTALCGATLLVIFAAIAAATGGGGAYMTVTTGLSASPFFISGVVCVGIAVVFSAFTAIGFVSFVVHLVKLSHTKGVGMRTPLNNGIVLEVCERLRLLEEERRNNFLAKLPAEGVGDTLSLKTVLEHIQTELDNHIDEESKQANLELLSAVASQIDKLNHLSWGDEGWNQIFLIALYDAVSAVSVSAARKDVKDAILISLLIGIDDLEEVYKKLLLQDPEFNNKFLKKIPTEKEDNIELSFESILKHINRRLEEDEVSQEGKEADMQFIAGLTILDQLYELHCDLAKGEWNSVLLMNLYVVVLATHVKSDTGRELRVDTLYALLKGMQNPTTVYNELLLQKNATFRKKFLEGLPPTFYEEGVCLKGFLLHVNEHFEMMSEDDRNAVFELIASLTIFNQVNGLRTDLEKMEWHFGVLLSLYKAISAQVVKEEKQDNKDTILGCLLVAMGDNIIWFPEGFCELLEREWGSHSEIASPERVKDLYNKMDEENQQNFLKDLADYSCNAEVRKAIGV